MRVMGVLLSVVLLAGPVAGQDLPFVNWENHPVHPMDISPDGRTLAVTHTADNRLQLFDVSEGRAVPAGHIPVGVDPVSVRFRTATEAWVVNHISDSVNVVDIASGRTLATLATEDEPFDVVFAGSPQRAYVSCSQANMVLVFDPQDLSATPQQIAIDAEDPRALAVSPDGMTVYVAIFESGNGSTVLGGGIEDPDDLDFPPNVTSGVTTPYGGQNPPPNDGTGFTPAMSPLLPQPPAVGLIVRQDGQGRWMDDNGGDWTAFVSGPQAAQSGRVSGWSLPDRDIAIIDTASGSVSYATGLMNIGMALSVQPATGELVLVGTDATNEIRFEPNVNGSFVRVQIAIVDAGNPANVQVRDLNTHLDYQQPTIPQAQRDQSVGDPRGIAWQADGQRGFVTGMGSNNLVVVDENGLRIDAIDPVEVGEGPTGVVLDEARNVAYVWNHFEASLSTIDIDSLGEIERQSVFNPLPAAIREGRQFLYGTHESSGLGQLSCASCHVDARVDRLAWDLGDPSGSMKAFNQNCTTDVFGDNCEDFHPMKGPMMTQTFQDIIGHEPFHWRGDRDGLEEFNPAFTGLLGDDSPLSDADMQSFEDFLDSIVFPPNPFRNFNNSLPTNLPLDGHLTTGRFGPAGQPLGSGNAVRGVELYTQALVDDPFHCSNCHTLPTGMAVNGPMTVGDGPLISGGNVMQTGPNGENHLGVVSVDGSTNRAIKVPQLRNMYDKVGMQSDQTESRAGFGFLHDGSIDSLARFLSLDAFENIDSDQDVADLVALMLAFSGSDFAGIPLADDAPPSGDTHAAVGAQQTLTGSSSTTRLNQMITQAGTGRVDLVAHQPGRGWAYAAGSNLFTADDGSPSRNFAQMRNLATPSSPLTFTIVPAGLAARLGNDRDGDGVFDGLELAQGSSPADATSKSLAPVQGLWFNPARSGHGFDLQILGDFMFITWYTYNDDATPTWYQASGPLASTWNADLFRFNWLPEGGVEGEVVGAATLDFEDASHARFDWSLGERSGSEPFEVLMMSTDRTLRNYTGTWYDPGDPGWGATFYVQGDVRVTVLYFYDADNQPRWALGQGNNSAAGLTEMLSFTGFCPDCERIEPVFVAAGQVDVTFADERSGSFTSTTGFPGLADSDWVRTEVDFVSLSDAWRDPALD
jgi:DNA-binding beta-propeller fold protein YncE